MDLITSHDHACKVLEKDPVQSVTTDQKISDFFKAQNKLSNFKADFKDREQRKWRPFYYVDASGFRFYDSGYDDSHSVTDVGSRLCHFVKTKEESDHLGQLPELLKIQETHYYEE